MSTITEQEAKFRKSTGHASTCNCIREWRGRLLVNRRRRCTCGSDDMTRERAFDLVEKEMGPLTAANHKAFTKAVLALEKAAALKRKDKET